MTSKSCSLFVDLSMRWGNGKHSGQERSGVSERLSEPELRGVNMDRNDFICDCTASHETSPSDWTTARAKASVANMCMMSSLIVFLQVVHVGAIGGHTFRKPEQPMT